MVQHHAVNVCFGLVGPWILKRGWVECKIFGEVKYGMWRGHWNHFIKCNGEGVVVITENDLLLLVV
jgi:hypothetical protein